MYCLQGRWVHLFWLARHLCRCVLGLLDALMILTLRFSNVFNIFSLRVGPVFCFSGREGLSRVEDNIKV